MNKPYQELIDLLTKQKGLYASLLDLAEKVGARLESEKDMQSLTPLFAEREKLFKSIQQIDAMLTDIVQKSGDEKLLEKPEAVALVDDLKIVVKRLMDEDERFSEKIKSLKSSTQKEFSSLTTSRKGVSGYADTGKQVYAKFIDIKR